MSESVSNRLSVAGIIFGLLGILTGSVHFFLGPVEPTPTIESFVEEKARSIKDAVVSGLKGGSKYAGETVPQFGIDKIIDTAVIVMGVVALALGVFALVRKEEMRPTSAALVLGSASILIQFAIALVGAILGVMLLVAILGTVGDWAG